MEQNQDQGVFRMEKKEEKRGEMGKKSYSCPTFLDLIYNVLKGGSQICPPKPNF